MFIHGGGDFIKIAPTIEKWKKTDRLALCFGDRTPRRSVGDVCTNKDSRAVQGGITPPSRVGFAVLSLWRCWSSWCIKRPSSSIPFRQLLLLFYQQQLHTECGSHRQRPSAAASSSFAEPNRRRRLRLAPLLWLIKIVEGEPLLRVAARRPACKCLWDRMEACWGSVDPKL